MNWVVRSWWWLVDWLGPQGSLATEVVENFPDVIEPGRVYLIGGGSVPWSAALLCPCGCSVTIRLSLVKNDLPRWHAKRHFTGKVTLHPSIWRNKGCRSHFFLRRGRIIWARDRVAAHLGKSSY